DQDLRDVGYERGGMVLEERVRHVGSVRQLAAQPADERLRDIVELAQERAAHLRHARRIGLGYQLVPVIAAALCAGARQPQCERGTATGSAAHGDVATHELSQLAADSQAQSGTAMGPRVTLQHLLEGTEDSLQVRR